MKHRPSVSFLLLTLPWVIWGCVKSSVESPSRQGIVPQCLWEGIRGPKSSVVFSTDRYLVSHVDEDGQGVISKIEKGAVSLLFRGLSSPGGMAVDPRRKQVYILDGSVVKIFQWKNPEVPPVEISVPTNSNLSHVTFSIMNRKAYVSDSAADSIWVVDPKKKSVALFIEPESFRRAAYSAPGAITISSDGTRLYVVASKREESIERELALLHVDVRTKNIFVLHRLEKESCVVGTGFYRDHFVFAACRGAKVYAWSKRNNTVIPFPLTPESLNEPLALDMDLSQIVLLDRMVDSEQGRLLRFPVTIKY